MTDTREAIMVAARNVAQAHGYAGLNFRDLGTKVGIRSATIHYYFPTKATLGAAVARRYWEDSKARLNALWAESGDPAACLAQYPSLFRKALENGNRMCLCGFMAAEHDDLPDEVREEVLTFLDVQIAWLARMLGAIDPTAVDKVVVRRARAICAAIGGAQLVARACADAMVFDDIIAGYRESGLLPT